MPSSQVPEEPSHQDTRSAPTRALHVNAWNILLLIPLLMLVTPVFNMDSPRLFGMPFYYWYQFAWVPVGVICVGLVYVMTKDPALPESPAQPRSPDPGTASDKRADVPDPGSDR